MDVKPASVTKEKSFLEEHERFLKIALKKEVFIKVICSKEIDLNEFQELCRMVRNVILSEAKNLKRDPSAAPQDDRLSVPLILQPISAETEGHEDPELMRLLGELQTLALGILSDVRIVPRLHKIIKIK